MMQQETGELKASEDGSVEFETPTDDEEITIPSQDRNKEVPDVSDSDICDEQTLSNTQREDLHGARPRQTGRVYHVRYDPYLNLSLMVFRRTVYEMAVSVRRTLGRRWIC